MKKTVLTLCMALILVLGNVTAALADAIAYDMEEAGYYVYVATPDGGLNMRHGPGTEYDKVMQNRIPDGVRLYIGYVSGNWGYTSYNGNEGWVALKQTTTAPPDTVTYDKEEAGYYVYVATPDGGLNMRKGPGTEYDKVTQNRIPDGVRLYIGYVSGNWGYTSYNGNEGWVALKQTTTNPPKSQSTSIPSVVQIPIEEEEPKNEDDDATVEEEILKEETDITEPSAEVAETEQDNSEDAENVKTAMIRQIVLAAALVVLVIVIAILIVIFINLNARR